MRSDRTVAVLLVLPSLIAVGIFVYGFIGWTGYVSLSRWSGLIPDYHYVGGDNYQRLAENPRFQADIRNTIVFTALFLLSATVLGFLAAALLDQKIKWEAFFRGVFPTPRRTHATAAIERRTTPATAVFEWDSDL
jgi:glucose/mannose transport system permease protein